MSKSKPKETQKKKRSVGRVIGKIILVLMLLILLALLAGGLWFYNTYGEDLLALKDKAEWIAARSKEEDFRASETSICYYQDGSVMSVLKGEKDVYYLPYEAIPKYAVDAFLATEDRKFWTHSGYDIYAIGRAAKAYLTNEGKITQGGSTITQQLARTIYLSNEKTVERKVTEIFTAAALEKKYSKDKILEYYINNVYYSNGYYGIQAAAEGYFGKSVDELTLSQIAFICGIPNSPSDYNPVRRFESTLERRDSVLKQMRENGYISGNEYNEALNEEIQITTTKYDKHDYAETFTYYCAVKALMRVEGFTERITFLDSVDEENYEELYEEEYYRLKRSLYTKGYRIYTSLNPQKQQQLQDSINEQLADFTETNSEGIYALQASGVCIDNETGFVAAIIGGRGQEYDGYTLNRAFQSPRQPGSSIKPLIVYTPCFENGYYPDDIVLDEKFEGGPRNSGGVYSGEIELRYAISVSKNTIAWKLFEEITPRVGLGYLRRMGFSHLVETDFVPAAALGGLTYGATALEMTSGYAALCNNGVYRTPTCILRITDADGYAVVDNTQKESRQAGNALSGVTKTASPSGGLCTAGETRIYQKNAALIMTDCMKTVMTSGTGRRLALENMISAGKTGTTNDQKDGWFVGFTKYYTTGIWVGYDYPKTMEDLMGNTYPGHIWKSFMDKIHKGLPAADFEPYFDPRPKPVEEEPDDDTDNPDESGQEGNSEGEYPESFGEYPENGDDAGPVGNAAEGQGSMEQNIFGESYRDIYGNRLLFIGEDGSAIYLSEDIDEEAELDHEGKPIYYDDEDNRIFYDNAGRAVVVAPDGMPEGYFEPGGWTLYDAEGNVVMVKSQPEENE